MLPNRCACCTNVTNRGGRYAHRVARSAPRLTARSVIASTLLGVDPPRLPTRSLIRTAELLGISRGTTRVAISRMVTNGELEADGDAYALASTALLDRRLRQEQSRAGNTTEWDGDWNLVVVDADARSPAERADLRRALGTLRHAEVREGIWTRPDNLRTGVFPAAEATVTAQCIRFTGRPDADPGALARTLWPLTDWAAEADHLRRTLDGLTERIRADDPAALGEGFVANASVLRHLQADPLLPAELLPTGWPGPDLRHHHTEFDRLFKERLVTWLRSERRGSATADRTGTSR